MNGGCRERARTGAIVSVAAAIGAALRRGPSLRGRGALAQRAHQLLARGGSPGVGGARSLNVPMALGHVMCAPASSGQTWGAVFTGRYDDEVLELLGAWILPGSLVLDVGASLGFYTVPLAVRSRADGSKVVAFEPLPENLAVLRENLARNGLAGEVRVFACGLSDREASLSLRPEPGGQGNAVLGAAGPDQVPVRVLPLDSVRLPAARCSLVKLDVEGHEPRVLAGAEAFVAEHRPVIIGEFEAYWLAHFGWPPDAAQRWAVAHDYGCYAVRLRRRAAWTDRAHVTLASLSPGQPRADVGVLLVPSERAWPMAARRALDATEATRRR